MANSETPTERNTMFNRNPSVDQNLEDTLTNAYAELAGHEAHSDEYRNIVNQISALETIRCNKQPARVSMDTLVLAAANLAGIFLIINHENVNVITSKALPFVGKFK